MKIKNTKWICFILSIVIISSCSKSEEGKWKGVIKDEDGVKVVKNPKDPMYSGEIVKFEEELTIGNVEEPEEYLISHITSFAADDDGNIYILDIKANSIMVFNGSGKYLRSIGRSGQGPGEYQRPDNIQFTYQKEIMVHDRRGVLLFFSPEGRFLREIKRPVLTLSGYTLVSDLGNIYTFPSSIRDRQEKLIKMIPPYENFEVLTTREYQLESYSIPPPKIRYTLLPDGNMVWGISSKYEFHIIDSSGRIIKKIEKKHSPVPVSDEYKSKYLEILPQGFSKEEHSKRFSSYFPAFDFFFSDEAGHLFVKTYEKKEATDKYIIDVFDPEGRFLTRTALKVGNEISLDQDKFIIKKNRLYAEEYSEEGFPVLKRYRILWNY